MRQHAGAAAGGVSSEIDGDVDRMVRHEGGDGEVLQCAHIDETVEAVRKTLSQAAAVVGAGGVRIRLEALAVMRFEHAGQQLSDRVLAQVRRQVAYPEPVTAALAVPLHGSLDTSFSTSALIQGRFAIRQEGERTFRRLISADSRGNRCNQPIQMPPITRL